MNWQRNGLYTAFLVLLVALIAWGGLRDVPPVPKFFEGQDKLEHLMAFSALTLWLAALVRPSRWQLAAGLSAMAALLLEVAQGLFSVHRSASLGDLLASMIGIALAAAFILAMRRTLVSRSAARS